ncbi:MAG: serine hydrolase domain-containing protein [Candidatus Dormibacteraceae bacterium]
MTALSLPRSRPSEQGVAAAGVLAYLDGVERAGIDLHSLMVVRHGAVVAEGWWAPYSADRVHLLYSLSKSFTSSAIGIAEAEGLLSIDDLVLDHFPDEAPANPSPHLRAMRVRDLLAMASGHREDTVERVMAGAPDLVRAFLALPPEHAPGTRFTYNQGCTHTLAVLVRRRSGRSLLDFLRPRLLDPLGIDQAIWTLASDGVEQGYSGLHAVTESVAKLGQLYLQRGRWRGRQLIPETYVEEATRKQVENRDQAENPDWQQGYGFQFWRCRGDAFRGDGAFGQFCVVLPGKDAVVACTAQTAEMQAELDLVWEHLLPAMGAADLEPDERAEEQLARRLGDLSTARVEGRSQGPREAVGFEPEGETAGLRRLRVERTSEGPRLTIEHAAGAVAVDLRPGRWAGADLPGVRTLLPPIAISGGWVSEREFRADLVFLTSPHRLSLRGIAGPIPRYTATWVQAPL